MRRLDLVLALVAASSCARMLSAQTVIEGTVRSDDPGSVAPVVYLVPANGVVRAGEGEVTIDQAGLRYLPAVVPVPPGTRITFRNSDAILHNVFSPVGPGGGFDLGTFPRDEVRSHVFDELGTYIILCHVHPEMYAYVVVLPTPYLATADEAGQFRIEGVPAGTYFVRVWQRRTREYEHELEVGQEGQQRLDIVIRREG